MDVNALVNVFNSRNARKILWVRHLLDLRLMRPLPPKSPKTLERAALGGAVSVASSPEPQEQTEDVSVQGRTTQGYPVVESGNQGDPSVQQWMREKKICEDSNPISWKLCLLGSVSLALAIFSAFGARSVVAEFLLRTADTVLPFHVHRGAPAAVSTAHVQARRTALAGDMGRAVEMYKKAVSECDLKNPARPELLNDLGVALTASGNNAEAARYLKEAIQLNPNLIAAYNNLAISQMLSGDKASAMATLEDAVRVQPQNEIAALKLKRMWANSSEEPGRTPEEEAQQELRALRPQLSSEPPLSSPPKAAQHQTY